MNHKNWQIDDVTQLFDLPFIELMYQAQTVHRQNFNPNTLQASALLSIKTGACPEDCAYCPQSGHYNTALEKEKLITVSAVTEAAKAAQQAGATRFCMGAAWRKIPDKSMDEIKEMIQAVKSLGMESCVTLGMLDHAQAKELKSAGLDYYNHNLDTSPEYYSEIISTRTYADRMKTLEAVRQADINVCCGGILGMGESREDRIGLLMHLANQESPPQSVPLNQLIPIPGTPLADTDPISELEFIRTVAVARLMMPQSYIRLSAGRENMSESMQAWCFFAGANSIFYGETLLTAANQSVDRDKAMIADLGMQFEAAS